MDIIIIMKKILLSVCLMASVAVAFAQAREGAIEVQKKMQPAAIIELAYPTDVINAALNDYLSKKGKSKGTDIKGFTTYRNTQQLQGENANADLYFRIVRKSRQEKQISTVYLLLTPPEETSATGQPLHHLNMDEAKTYLNELVSTIEAYNLELQIKEQNKLVASSEAKQKNLLSDGEDLVKKKAAVEQKIADNKLQQQSQELEVQNQKQKLAALVSQRKS
jgi:hypothetical protein